MHSPSHIYTKYNSHIRQLRKPLAPAPASRPRDRVSASLHSPSLFGKPKAEAPISRSCRSRGGAAYRTCQGLTGAALGYRGLRVHLSFTLFRRRCVASLRLPRAFDGMHMSVGILIQSHVPGLPVRRQGRGRLACCQDVGIFLLWRRMLSSCHPLLLCNIGNVKGSLPCTAFCVGELATKCGPFIGCL